MKLPRLVFIRVLTAGLLLLTLTACQAQKITPAAFRAEKLAEIDATIETAITEKRRRAASSGWSARGPFTSAPTAGARCSQSRSR